MMLQQRRSRIIACVGFTFVLLSIVTWADVSPRSIVHFNAVHGRYSFSIPWDLAKPVVNVPLKVSNRTTSLAIFRGHVKDGGDAGKDVLGGDLTLQQMGRTKKVFQNIWKERLAEVGTVQMPRGNLEEVYFVTMEGSSFQVWHFNLLNPQTLNLITLSYSWGHDDTTALKKTSDNFDAPEMTHERELLEGLTQDPDYGIPLKKK